VRGARDDWRRYLDVDLLRRVQVVDAVGRVAVEHRVAKELERFLLCVT